MTKRAKFLGAVLVLVSGVALADPGVLGNIILLQKIVFASFPAASATNEGGLLYDDTSNAARFSTGATWTQLGGTGTVTTNGAWTTGCTSTAAQCVAGLNFRSGYQTIGAGGQFRNIACNWAAAGSAGTLTMRIQNLTDATTLCSCSLGSCAGAAYTSPPFCDCAGTFVAGKMYVVQIDPATTCATPPTEMNCTTTITP